MVTGYEVEYYQHVASIDRSLNRIANLMEAQEKRSREYAPPLANPMSGGEHGLGYCAEEGCEHSALVVINGLGFCREHLDVAFAQAKEVMAQARSNVRSIKKDDDA